MSKFYDLLLAKALAGGGGGGGTSGLEYEAGEWTPSEDTNHGAITFAREHTEAPLAYAVAYDGEPTAGTDMSVMGCFYFDVNKMIGKGLPYGNSGNYFRYSIGEVPYQYNSALHNQFIACGKSSDDPGASSENYARFWATESGIYPYSDNASRYFRAGVVYKWLAIWKPSE